MSDLLNQIPFREELQDLQEEFQDAQLNKSYTTIQERKNSCNKIVPSLEEAIRRSGLKDGMMISFHHHFLQRRLYCQHGCGQAGGEIP